MYVRESKILKRSDIRRAGAVLAATLLVLGVATCESPTAPSGPSGRSGRIPVGDSLGATLTRSDSVRDYSFEVTTGSTYVLFVSVTSGMLALYVRDSLSNVVAASAVVAPNGIPLVDDPVITFVPQTTGTWLVHALPLLPDSTTTFKLMVFEVNSAPEIAPPTFAIGDTVHGETIEPAGDIDIFSASVDSGQDLVAVGEAPSVSGLGPLLLAVMDPSGATVGQGYFASGGPAQQTTGRIHAAATGTYRFKFHGAAGFAGGIPSPPFHGAYRFWTYAINRAPERLPAAIRTSTVIAGESIDKTGDVDEFIFSDTAGAEVNVFYQAAVKSHVELARAGGAMLGSVAAGPDTGLYSQFTGRLALPQAGSYTVRVAGDGILLSDTGAYRLFVYPIDRRPEHVNAAIAPGDTVTGESIDLPGDIDEFTFTAAAGQVYYAFLRAESGSAATQLQLDVVDSGGAVLGSAFSVGTDTALRTQMTPSIRVPTSRTVRLRVYGGTDASTGPYRILLYQVNPAPESHPDTTALGDSVVGESIDFPGDVDQFRVHVGRPTNLNVIASYRGFVRTGTSIGVSVSDSASGAAVASASVFTDSVFATGGVAVGAGTYIVRVAAQGFDGRPAAWGPYRLWVVNYSSEPDATRDTIAVGDTVQGERIDVPGDVDTYHFLGAKGQHLNFMLQGQTAAPDTGWFGLSVQPPGASYATLYVQSPWANAALSDHQTLRYDLPTGGWYTVTLTGQRPLPVPVAPLGPFRFAVVSIDSAPETHAATFAVGDSVANEAIDYLGDWDHFTLTATPGQVLYLLFGTGPSTPCCSYYPYVVALDPATGDTLTSQVGQFMRVTSPFVAPTGGAVTINVFEYPHVLNPPTRACYDATCGVVYGFTGPYTLQALAVDSLPEVASPTYVLSDTVSTEAIAPAGDVDQFTLTVTPGDTLSEWFRLRADPTLAGGYISMEVFDAGTGAQLTGANSGLTAATTAFHSWGQFVVPASGRLLIRFRGTGTTGWDATTAPYAFFLKRGP